MKQSKTEGAPGFAGVKAFSGGFGFTEPKSLDEHLDEFKSDDGYEPSALPQPTDFPPGSPDKVQLMRERLERDEHLWHPNDAAAEWRKNLYHEITGIGWDDLR